MMFFSHMQWIIAWPHLQLLGLIFVADFAFLAQLAIDMDFLILIDLLSYYLLILLASNHICIDLRLVLKHVCILGQRYKFFYDFQWLFPFLGGEIRR